MLLMFLPTINWADQGMENVFKSKTKQEDKLVLDWMEKAILKKATLTQELKEVMHMYLELPMMMVLRGCQFVK